MERLMDRLATRLEDLPPSNPPTPTFIPPLVPPLPTVTDFPILVRNQRFARVLAVSHYRLRDQDTNLHPDQMGNLSSSTAIFAPAWMVIISVVLPL